MCDTTSVILADGMASISALLITVLTLVLSRCSSTVPASGSCLPFTSTDDKVLACLRLSTSVSSAACARPKALRLLAISTLSRRCLVVIPMGKFLV
jgi:hypothetical protein